MSAKGEILDIEELQSLANSSHLSEAILRAAANERKKAVLAEEQLRRSEECYRGLVESQDNLIVRIDWEGKFTFVNDAYCRKAGLTRADLIGQKFIPQVHRDDVEKVYKLMERLRHPPYRAIGEHRSRTRTGWRHTLWEAYAIKNESGEIIELQGVGRDITEQRKAERLLKEQGRELRHRNEELEQYVYVASHDLREPLRMIVSFLQLLEQRYGKLLPDEAKQYIQFAREGSDRMLTLIRDLLESSRISRNDLPKANVNCCEVLDMAFANLKMQIQETNTKIEAGPLPVVYGNSSQLVQLFQNLIDNAMKYRTAEDFPSVKISASSTKGHWLFAVEDNGIGIPPRFRQKIFELFQRLHSRSENSGNGIGLTIARKIVERHGGRIWTEAAAQRGSIFYFTLPRRERAGFVD